MKITIDIGEPTEDFTPRKVATLMKAVNAAAEITEQAFSIQLSNWDPEDMDDALDAYADGHTMAGSSLLTR